MTARVLGFVAVWEAWTVWQAVACRRQPAGGDEPSSLGRILSNNTSWTGVSSRPYCRGEVAAALAIPASGTEVSMAFENKQSSPIDNIWPIRKIKELIRKPIKGSKRTSDR
jgi:hypothetical protein